MAESLDNTHKFRQKIVHYLTLPEKELESYVASTYIHANIQDENNEEEVRFVIIFTSKRIYRLLHGAGDGDPSTKAVTDIFGKYLHPDCTHATRLTCWSNVHQNNSTGSKDKNAENNLQIDFENRQWS